jgi:uncharacterized membrane protein YdjX (TVP38/TMEM64 family)
MDLPEKIGVTGEGFPHSKPFLKALALLLILGAGLLVVYSSPLKGYLSNIRELNDTLARMGMVAPLFYTLGVFILVACGFPRLFLCPLGGMAFGLFWGLVLSQLGTLLGAYVQFLFIRWCGQSLALRRWPALSSWAHLFKDRGVPVIILLRQVPIPGIFGNVILALMQVRNVDFLVGTAIGILPEAVPSTMIGRGIVQQSFAKSFGYITGAIALFLVIWLISGFYVRSARRTMMVSDTDGELNGREKGKT